MKIYKTVILNNINISFLVLFLLFLLNKNSTCFACTIFNATKGDTMLVGNNKDWYDFETEIIFYPQSEGKYSRMCFNFLEGDHGGINDQGLLYDELSLTNRDINFPIDKPFYPGYIWYTILETCATVEEAITLIEKYNIVSLEWSHFMLVDASGESAVIEWGKDSLEIIRKEGSYQLLTNFTLNDPYVAGWYPCWRYNIADNMLQNEEVSIEYFRSILEAVHQEGSISTQYSYIYDVYKRLVHIYLNSNFNEVITIDLSQEFNKGFHKYNLSSLFTHVEFPSNYELKIPNKFQLFQNCPNPFNASTNIRYHLPISCFVILRIYNLAGQEIETLVNGFQAAGEHEITWTAEGLSSGIYFYRLQISNQIEELFSEFKKLILTK